MCLCRFVPEQLQSININNVKSKTEKRGKRSPSKKFVMRSRLFGVICHPENLFDI
jgi:hypothetical protein